jgi:zinc transport system permease protein
MQNALIVGVIISIIAGIVGTLIVENKMVFLSGAIAHSSYGGIGVAVMFGIPIFLGAFGFALFVAFLIAIFTIKDSKNIDSLIGVMWAIGMAIGIILIDLTPGYNVDLMGYLFGSIIAVSSKDIFYTLFLLAVIIFVVFKYYREILAVSYDKELALLQGVNIKFFHTLVLLLSAMSVVVAIKVVGLILVIALFTIPVYIASNFSSSLIGTMFLSSILSVIFTVVGLVISFYFDLTSGATIILVSGFFMMIAKLIQHLINK